MMAGAFSLAVAGCSDQAPSEADDTQIENTDEGTVQKLPDLTAGVFNLDDMIAQNPPQQRRGLTHSEEQLVQKITSRDIDTDNIEVLTYDRLPAFVNQSDYWRSNNKYIIVSSAEYQDDFYTSQRDSFVHFAGLISLMTQNRTVSAWEGADPSEGDNGFEYRFQPGKNFVEYTVMQRSQILQDYMHNFAHPASRTNPMNAYVDYLNRRAQNRGAEYTRPDSLSREQKAFIEMVEAEFPNLRDFRMDHMIEARPIHQNERAMAEMIFGDELDTSEMWFHMDPYTIQNNDGTHTAGMVYSPVDIIFFLRSNHADDYSRVEDANVINTLYHELTHNWQRQTDNQYTNEGFVNRGGKYQYPLDPDRWSFGDYGTEQQAAIIGDYASLFLHHGRCPDRLPSSLNGQEDNKADVEEAIKRLVESRFPRARETRLFFETNGHLPGMARVDSEAKIVDGRFQNACSHPAYERAPAGYFFRR